MSSQPTALPGISVSSSLAVIEQILLYTHSTKKHCEALLDKIEAWVSEHELSIKNLKVSTPSSLPEIKSALSKIQNIELELSSYFAWIEFCQASLEGAHGLESFATRLKKGLKDPKKFIRDQFEERVIEGFYNPATKLTSDYFNFLWTYLLCCFCAVKYRNEFGLGFPPDDEDYMKFARLVSESYGSEAVEGIQEYKYKKDYPFQTRFFEDAVYSFNNIHIHEKDSFIRLSYHCRFMLLIDLWVLKISELALNPITKDHWKETLEKANKQNKIEITAIKEARDILALDLALRVWEMVGFWRAKQQLENIRLQKSRQAMKTKRDNAKQEVVDLYHRIESIKLDTKPHKAATIIRKRLKKTKESRVPSVTTIKRYLREEGIGRKE